MDYLFLGVDISKDVLDYRVVNDKVEPVDLPMQCSNNYEGLSDLVQYIKELQKTDMVWVCAEHTGHYGTLLVSYLEKHQIRYSMVNSLEIIKSSGMTRGKTDPIDALRIASYAATFYHKLEPSHSGDENIKLMSILLTSRDQYVRIRTQLKNALKSFEINSKCIPLRKEIVVRKREIVRLDKRVSSLEKEILELIKSKEELSVNYNKITQVIGVGPITAAKFITTTKNFTAFKDPRKYSCFCGLAPFQYTSGTSVKGRTKTSRYRNKDMKSILFNAAGSAIQHDQQLRTYYNRKIEDGKHRLSVINAVANKLVLRIFAVVNRDEPFVKLSV